MKEIKKISEKLENFSKEFNYLKNEELPNRFLEIRQEIEKIFEILKKLKSTNNDNLAQLSNLSTETSNLDLVNEFNDKLSNKVNCEDFDRLLNEIAILNERINALGKDKPSSMTDINKNTTNIMSSKDSNLIKDLSTKVNDLESLLRKLQKYFLFFF